MTSLCIALLVLAGCAQPDPRDRQLARTSQLEPIGEVSDHHVIYVPAYSHLYTGNGLLNTIRQNSS